MAERIESLSPPGSGRPPLYPWAKWLDGSAWRIKRGEDFQVPATSMVAIINQAAARRGLSVSCRRFGEDAVEFQASAEEAAA